MGMGAKAGVSKAGVSSGFWILCRGRECVRWPAVLDLPFFGETVAVFSFEEEARLFLDLRGAKDGLRPVRVSAGRLLSLFKGSWPGFGSVALDPIPELDAGTLLPLTTTSRERFVHFLRYMERSEAGTALPVAR
jgi:hypothetical protein